MGSTKRGWVSRRFAGARPEGLHARGCFDAAWRLARDHAPRDSNGAGAASPLPHRLPDRMEGDGARIKGTGATVFTKGRRKNQQKIEKIKNPNQGSTCTSLMQTGAGCFLDLEGRPLQMGAGFLLKLATAPRRSTTAQTRSRYSQRNFAGWPTPHTRWAMRRVLFLQRGANRSLEFEGWVCFLLKLDPPPPRRSICDTCSRSPCGTVARLSGVSSMTPGLVTSESWHPGAIPIYDTIRIPTRRPHGPATSQPPGPTGEEPQAEEPSGNQGGAPPGPIVLQK